MSLLLLEQAVKMETEEKPVQGLVSEPRSSLEHVLIPYCSRRQTGVIFVNFPKTNRETMSRGPNPL